MLSMPYTIHRSRRKTCAISLSQEHGVVIRAPQYLSDREIHRILEKKKDWIEKKYAEMQRKRARVSNLQSDDWTAQEKEELEKKGRAEAKSRIQEIAKEYAKVLGVTFHRITIRDQKTRWGSCSARGNLSFQWRLILAPLPVMKYVVIHELCHLREMNHSKEFWKLVESVMPDYRMQRKWLKEHGYELYSRWS